MLCGTTIFCAVPGDEPHLVAAKAYIARYKLTPEDVKLGYTKNGAICVVTKREISLDEGNEPCPENTA